LTPHLVVLLGYAALLTLLGVRLGRRVGTSGAFFVAGRRLGPGLVFATILAANIGAGSTVGAAGLGYRHGVSAWWWVGSAGIGTLVLGLWIGPRIWRVAREHDLYTAGDFLELRYGSAVRAVAAALLWLATLTILAGQLIALAWVLDVVAGIPKLAGCLVGGAVMTIYFAAGGLFSSAWVNLVQLVVLLVGFAAALPWALAGAGGWDAIRVAAPPGSDTWLDFWSGGTPWWAYLALLAPAFVVSPGLLQKVYGARDERAVRLGVGVSALVLMLFAAIPPLLGMCARVLSPELANPELALPAVLTHGLPLALGGLGLAAIISAELSSADAILFMLATSLSKDLYRRFLRPQATDGDVLRVGRWAAVAGGALGVFLAIVLPSVIASLSIFYSVLGVCLFVPVVAGLYSRRPGTPEALAAIGGGLVILVGFQLARVSAGGWLSPSIVALAASALGFGAVWVARVTGRRARPGVAPGSR
jgi:SSS family solute:Na+ symporter